MLDAGGMWVKVDAGADWWRVARDKKTADYIPDEMSTGEMFSNDQSLQDLGSDSISCWEFLQDCEP